jgi:hypothetical protein
MALFSLANVHAQSWTVSYPMSLPLGDLHNYSSNTSFRGINFEFSKRVRSNVEANLETGWNVFYHHEDTKEYKVGTASITGSQYRYTNAVPILAGLKLYPKGITKGVSPFVGLGLGTLYVNRSTDFGLYRITTETWQFCIRPEAGFLFQLQPSTYLFAGLKYYLPFSTNDLDGQSYLSLNIGLKFSAY